MISHNVSCESFQQFFQTNLAVMLSQYLFYQCDRSGELSEVSVLIGLTDLHFPFHCIYGLSGGWEGPTFSGIPIVHRWPEVHTVGNLCYSPQSPLLHYHLSIFNFELVFAQLFLDFWQLLSCSLLGFCRKTLMLRRRRQFVLRPSQILTPCCNFVLTGTGIATLIRQNILEFLAVGSCAIINLCNCSTAVFASSINWTQVDTPSVADDPDSDDN